jgi:hypothetical protein
MGGSYTSNDMSEDKVGGREIDSSIDRQVSEKIMDELLSEPEAWQTALNKDREYRESSAYRCSLPTFESTDIDDCHRTTCSAGEASSLLNKESARLENESLNDEERLDYKALELENTGERLSAAQLREQSEELGTLRPALQSSDDGQKRFAAELIELRRQSLAG